MTTLGTILGVLIAANICMSLINRNFIAFCGWLVAAMEWSRRIV